MAGHFALVAKIFGSFDQPGSKVILPKTIDSHPGRQGMFGQTQPLGQSQAVFGQVIGPGQKGGRRIGKNLLARHIVIAPVQQESLFRLLHFLHHHQFFDLLDGVREFGTAYLEGFACFLQEGRNGLLVISQ